MDRTEEQYDPDGDVSRFLGSPDHPGLLLSLLPVSSQHVQEPMLSQLPQEGHDHASVQLFDVQEIHQALPVLPHGGLEQGPLTLPQEAVQHVPEISSSVPSVDHHVVTGVTTEPLSVEGAIIAAMEGIQLEGSSSSNPRNDSTYEPIFHHCLPGHRDCNGCVPLRTVLHTSSIRNLVFTVHGGIGTFDHAVFDVVYLGRDGRPTTRDRFYVDLSMRSHNWVKSFIVGFTTLLQTDTSGTIHDSLNSFYSTLCADMNTSEMDEKLCMDLASWFQGSPDFEVGESSHIEEEIFENGDSGLDLPVVPKPTAMAPNPSQFSLFGTIITPAMPAPGAGNSSVIAGNSSGTATVDPGTQQTVPVEDAPYAYQRFSGQYSQLALQRQRTANMRLSDLAAYLHLSLEVAAKRLKLCSTALKKVCRRNGMNKWPARQIQSINKKLQKLDKKLTERRKFLYGWAIIKDKMEDLQRQKIEIYQRLHQNLNDNPENHGNEANNGAGSNSDGNNSDGNENDSTGNDNKNGNRAWQ